MVTCELGALLRELAMYEISVQSARDKFRADCSHAWMRDVLCRGRCCLAVRNPHEAGTCDPLPDQPNCLPRANLWDGM